MNFSLSILIIIVASIDAQELVDIPTTATNAGSFTTLITALQNADLVDALSAPNGPFTVFAPVDDAFAALPSGLLSCLLKPSNIDALRSVLTYHVVSDEIKSTDLVDALNSPTLSGERIFIDLSDGVTVNDEIVAITPDVATSNGVIHIIGSGK